LLHLKTGRVLQVDKIVYDAVNEGESMWKGAWSRHLQHDGHHIELKWSRDFDGMVIAMPAILVVTLATALCVHRCRR